MTRRVVRGFRAVLATRRGASILLRNMLATFGVVGGSLQVYDILTPQATYSAWVVVVLLAVVPVLVGFSRAWPRHTLTRDLGRPEVTVEVVVGDLLERDTHLVVGYTDTFDTDTTDPRVIHSGSLQAQFQSRYYPNLAVLDAEIEAALAHVPVVEAPTKELGTNRRYPLGTVAVLKAGNHQAFCLAYAVMGDDLVARATASDIWNSLDGLWDAVDARAHREPVSIAVVGSQLANVDSLDRGSLIRLIVLSFVARSRAKPVTRKLTVVIHPSDVNHVDMLELAAFLTTV